MALRSAAFHLFRQEFKNLFVHYAPAETTFVLRLECNGLNSVHLASAATDQRLLVSLA